MLAGVTVAAVMALCVLVFQPTLPGHFVWDDVPLVEHNRSLLRPEGIRRLLATDLWDGADGRPSVLYHPLPMVTLWLQARVTGLSLVAFRVGNLAAHLLCGLLLFVLLRRYLGSLTVATAAVLLFLIHPSVTEPVMWITGRHDSVAALCALGALLVWPGTGSRWAAPRAAGAGLLCALAFLSKEPFGVAVALLPARAVVDRVPWRRAVAWSLCAVGALALAVGLRRALGIPSTAVGVGGVATVLVSYATIVWHYLVQLVTVDNGAAIVSFRPLGWPSVVAVYVGLAAVTGVATRAAWSGRRQASLAWLGWFWFLIALVPHVISVPQFGVYGNRYAYFPLMGLLVAAAATADGLRARARPAVLGGATVLVCLVIVTASLRTADEARAWRDDLTLFGHKLDPEDGFALHQHANARLRREGCGAVLPELARVVELAPGLGGGWHLLAGCLLSTGRYERAVSAGARALALQPGSAGAEYNLGAALVFSGQTQRGIAHLERAARLDPGHVLTARLLATLRAAPVTSPGTDSPR